MVGPAAAHLLIAEDDQALRNLYQDLFTEEGYRVSLLAQLPDTTEVQRLTPDLLILDFFDGGSHTLELMRSLRTETATACLPIVVCSASLPQIREIEPDVAALDIPMLLKPFDVEELLAMVRQRLDPA